VINHIENEELMSLEKLKLEDDEVELMEGQNDSKSDSSEIDFT
jgi:hypothetical protein